MLKKHYKIIHVANESGHRGAYLGVFKVLFSGYKPLIGEITKKNLLTLIFAEKVLFATMGYKFYKYFFVSFLRFLIGKRTVVVFVGASKVLSRYKLKSDQINQIVFKVWKILPKNYVFGIMPFDVNPCLAKVCNGFIYDPQMWDLWLNGSPPEIKDTPLSKQVVELKKGRKVLIYLGKANKKKNFPGLVQFAKAHKEKFFIIAAGGVSKNCESQAASLISLGMMVEDRFISEEELLSLYKVADFSWCNYTPEFDQASGIFGRSIQLGVTPIVRHKSKISFLAKKYRIPAIRLEYENYSYLKPKREKVFQFETEFLIKEFKIEKVLSKLRNESLIKIFNSLGENDSGFLVKTL